MLVKVADRLYVGGVEECPLTNELRDWWGVVHAAKSPCHQAVVGYTKSLPPSHPQYLSARIGKSDLVLNLIDPPVPLFKAESFLLALDHIDQRIADGDVLIHCNRGESRAPAIACLYLAKRAKEIPGDSWREAVQAFLERCPDFRPGLGIDTFLAGNWGAIR